MEWIKDFLSDWITWTNFFYMVGLLISTVFLGTFNKYRVVWKEVGELVGALQTGLYDKKLDSKEREKIMKEALDVAKAIIALKWKISFRSKPKTR